MRRYIVTHTDDRQLDPVVHAATDTARRESEARAKLFKELTKYWSYLSDQASTIESQERCPRVLLPMFAEYAEGLCDARAAQSLNSATSIKAHLELIEHSIVPGILNQILPDESLTIPEPKPIGVRCIDTNKDRANRHRWDGIIGFDQDFFDYDACISPATIKEQPFCRDAQNRIIAMAESPSGDWEECIALTHRPTHPRSSGPKQWTDACHPFQLTLRRSESRTSFTEAIQALLALRIPDWSARFFKMTKARGTAVESDIPLATETLQSCEVPENPRTFVERQLGNLGIGLSRVATALHVGAHTALNVRKDLEKGHLRVKYRDNLARLLQLETKVLMNVIDRHNKGV